MLNENDPFDYGLTHAEAVAISQAMAENAEAWRKFRAGEPMPIELEPETDDQ
jgi:hypothetical protein